jgi:Rrf2 family cysteine metabolism transcriptional repressor
MKISQKLEYACRALAQMARRDDGRTLTRLDEIAQREAISANFLVQILNDLRRAGLVDSRRGKAGGYLLGRPAKEITLRQIVMAVDPALLQFSVSTEGESGAGVRAAWQRVSTAVSESLNQIVLQDMAEETGDQMFYI